MACIIGHPAGVPKRVEAGPVTGPSGTQIRYNDIDTLGGNSGSAILAGADEQIIGVHTNGGCNIQGTGSNFGVPIRAIINNSPTLQNILAQQPVRTGGGTRRVFGRDLAANTKSIYVVTNEDRLAQVWDTAGRNLDFPAENAGHTELRFQGGV